MLDRYLLQYTKRAEADLATIHAWIQGKSTEQIAADFIAGLKQFCESLQLAPSRGNLRPYKQTHVRGIGYKRSVTVVFRTNDGVVSILRLLYRGRNINTTHPR